VESLVPKPCPPPITVAGPEPHVRPGSRDATLRASRLNGRWRQIVGEELGDRGEVDQRLAKRPGGARLSSGVGSLRGDDGAHAGHEDLLMGLEVSIQGFLTLDVALSRGHDAKCGGSRRRQSRHPEV
jgi:hypothetical protein